MSDEKSTATFISCERLLEHFAGQFERCIETLCNQSTKLDKTHVHEVEKVVQHEKELVSFLRDYISSGSKSVLDTRIQFAEEPSQPDIDSPQEALQATTGLNDKMIRELQDQMAKNIPQDFKEALQNLAERIRETNQKISMVRVTEQDV